LSFPSWHSGSYAQLYGINRKVTFIAGDGIVLFLASAGVGFSYLDAGQHVIEQSIGASRNASSAFGRLEFHGSYYRFGD
jgi:hypothetical protein